MQCVEKALDSYSFLERCKSSTHLLHKIFDDLTESLNVDITPTSKDQCLYIIVGKKESKIVLMDKTKKKTLVDKLTSFICHQCEPLDVDREGTEKGLTFPSFVELSAHNLFCHATITCETCCQTFGNEEELALHRNSGHYFKCSQCDQYRNTEEALKEHFEKYHEIFMCAECGKSCKGFDKLQSHEEKHTSKSECPKCKKSYITKDFYYKHVKLCLADQLDPHPYRAKIKKKYVCEKCGKGYSTSGGLRVHNRFVHGNAKPHVCDQCGKEFTAPSYLKSHMIKHTGRKNFKCDICGNHFVSKEALLYHTRRHTGEKPYSCNLCSERFVNASARAEHIKFKHKAPTLTCEVCQRKFFTTTFLRQHTSRHHDPSSKLYSARSMVPPNMPGEQNMRNKVGDWSAAEVKED